MAPSNIWKAVLAILGLSLLPSVVSALPAPQDSGTACSGWTYIGCYLDTDDNHTLSVQVIPSTTEDTTIENCQAACLAQGYTISGAEFGYECWCDSAIQK